MEVVTGLAREVVDSLGLELVDVQYGKEQGRWILRVFIDRPEGITLADCQTTSEALSKRLDEADPIPGAYALEVSSPGLDRPLKHDADFTRFAGRPVRITTYAPVGGRKSWEGRLIGLVEGQVRLEADGREIALPRDQIAKARLKAEFKL